MVGVEGEHADHWTTTTTAATAQNSITFTLKRLDKNEFWLQGDRLRAIDPWRQHG